MDSTSDIRHEMAATRDQMARDVDALKDHLASPVRAAKQRLDVAELVREHPWSALGVAVVLGAVVGGSGADTKAVAATAVGAKRAARASKDAANGVIEKLHSDDSDASDPEPREQKPGIGGRLFGALGASVAGGIDRLLDEMRVASRDWSARVATPATGPRPPVIAKTVAVVAVAESIAPTAAATSQADAIPVPNEMVPAEVDARADAVEALGGGTHEPPLAPGAGDLGARWA
jgi:hypothetical protein